MSSSASSQNLSICVSPELVQFCLYFSILISYALLSHFSSTIRKTFKYLPVGSKDNRAKTSVLILWTFFLSHLRNNTQLHLGITFISVWNINVEFRLEGYKEIKLKNAQIGSSLVV